MTTQQHILSFVKNGHFFKFKKWLEYCKCMSNIQICQFTKEKI